MIYCEALIRDNLSMFWTPELRERFFRLVMQLVPHWKGGFTARARREHILNKAIQMLTEPGTAAIHRTDRCIKKAGQRDSDNPKDLCSQMDAG